MALINFTDLDFDQIKTSIKDYLRANSTFTDFDYEGSNLSILLDVLAYNTYITAYNANMVSNEVFIDSATLRENVVSLARNIGYVPKSITCSSSSVSFFVDVSNYPEATKPKTLTLKSGIVCTSDTFNASNYIFSIPDDITVPVVDNLARFSNITIYEGSLLKSSFNIDTSQPNQRFVLQNSNIDTSTIRVLVKRLDSQNEIARKYNQISNIFDVNSNSEIYLLQEVEDERYELIFGDGNFGKKLNTGNYIEATYIVTNGPDANGTSGFRFSGILEDNNGVSVTTGISLITTILSSSGGKEIESVDSIKKYAPRRYSTQNRAVTATDFESIIPVIYPNSESVTVFGGEELNPPKYGKVFITIKPKDGQYLSNFIKKNIVRDLKKYAVAGIVPEIIDAKYLYVETSSSVYYNTNSALSSEDLKTKITNAIDTYSKSNELNTFGGRFKYSKFQRTIDNVSDSVTSNITTVRMRRDLRPIINSFTNYEICFGNKFHFSPNQRFNIKSSGFKVSGISETVYLSDLPSIDGTTGTMFLFKLYSSTDYEIVKNNVGTIDYVSGEIMLNTLNITSTLLTNSGENIIQIQAIPESNDVIGLQDLYIKYDSTNSIVEMIGDVIDSGSDISGSTYTFSSSFTNGSLTR
jgi:hypothetical protein